MKRNKPGMYERSKHTGVFCPECNSEMDQAGQIAHKSQCSKLMNEIDKEKEVISDHEIVNQMCTASL